MRRVVKFALPAMIVSVGILITSGVSFAKPEYTKKEKKGCTYCHTSAKSKDLNDAGKYYQEHKTLDGYKPK
jgi:hypothetical protein